MYWLFSLAFFLSVSVTDSLCSDSTPKGIEDCLMRMSFLLKENCEPVGSGMRCIPTSEAALFKKTFLPAGGPSPYPFDEALDPVLRPRLIADEFRGHVATLLTMCSDQSDSSLGGDAGDYYSFVYSSCYLSGSFDGVTISTRDGAHATNSALLGLKKLVEEHDMPEAACFLLCAFELISSDAACAGILNDLAGAGWVPSFFERCRALCGQMDAAVGSTAYAIVWAAEKEWCAYFASKYVRAYKVLK